MNEFLPKGFKAAGVHCGIRKNKTKRDLALIMSETRASAAAVYTQNAVKGAPIIATKQNIADGFAQCVICNSGNANTCNPNGLEIANEMCTLLANAAGISASDVIVASTGVIGQPLDIEPIKRGIPSLIETLTESPDAAAEAIMTTDTIRKLVSESVTLDGKACSVCGMAKGSGMIHPNMATMLCFITTDAAITPKMLKCALTAAVSDTFNMVTVDGDTSTNDMCSVLANGMAGNAEITDFCSDYDAFAAALKNVCKKLARLMASDGEGCTKLLECRVEGATSTEQARKIAKGVVSSSLLKAAMFGADANWGRVLCAIGYTAPEVDVSKIAVGFESSAGTLPVCEGGAGVPFSEEFAKTVLSEKEIIINVAMNDGEASATAWGCDLTYDYVKINGDYRT